MAEPIIETERLLLRPPRACDLDGWAAFSADEQAMRFLGGVQPRSLAWRNMAATAGSWSLQGFGMFSVLLRETGRWIGRVGPLRPEGWPAPEIGWGLLPDFHRQGFAREAATAAATFAFGRLKWPAIHHVIDPENDASIAVARSIGSRLLGPTRLPEPYRDSRVDLWGQSLAEWRSRRPSEPPAHRDGLAISVSTELGEQDQAVLEAGLDDFNASRVGPDQTHPLWIVARDTAGRLVGGARCVVMWQWLLIDWLWVAEDHRGAGLGASVLGRAEAAGVVHGCSRALLNTFSFQAPDFYRRHGYDVFGQLANMPPGHERYWMSKVLASP